MPNKVVVLASVAVAFCAVSAAAQGQRRQLAPHQHGHGTVNIAIDGSRVEIDLDVPAADILGFENAPATAAEKVAVERAAALLHDAASLFVMPAAAGCRVEDVEIKMEPSGAEHADYEVEFAFVCATPAVLTGITFAYFDKFPAASGLTVNVATGRGQNRSELSRDARRLNLGGN
jgi:hypothetical protein